MIWSDRDADFLWTGRTIYFSRVIFLPWLSYRLTMRCWWLQHHHQCRSTHVQTDILTSMVCGQYGKRSATKMKREKKTPENINISEVMCHYCMAMVLRFLLFTHTYYRNNGIWNTWKASSSLNGIAVLLHKREQVHRHTSNRRNLVTIAFSWHWLNTIYKY